MHEATYQASIGYEAPNPLPGTVYGYGATAVAALADLRGEVAAMGRGKGKVVTVGKARVGIYRPE